MIFGHPSPASIRYERRPTMRARLDFEQRAEAMQLSETMDIDDLAYEYVGVRDRLKEAEAQAAAYRESLEGISSDLAGDPMAEVLYSHLSVLEKHDAGRYILGELERLRREN